MRARVPQTGFAFEPDDLHVIARSAAGLPFEDMCREVLTQLDTAYPGRIDGRREWVFNLAAGATGIMNVLHGSLSEYLIIFGTPIGTEAWSGRYRLDIHDFVMAGEMWTYTEDRPGERVVTAPGERAVLRSGAVKGFRFEPGSWVLEYGRGPIPTSLPTAVADALLSGLDPATVIKTFRIYGEQVVRQLLGGKV